MSWVVTWKGALVSYGVASIVFTVGWAIFFRGSNSDVPTPRPDDAAKNKAAWDALRARTDLAPEVKRALDDIDRRDYDRRFAQIIRAESRIDHPSHGPYLCHCDPPVPDDIGECADCHRLVDPRRAAE
jgi:hypothetical protein